MLLLQVLILLLISSQHGEIFYNNTNASSSDIIIDSDLTFEDAIKGKEIPLRVKNNLVLIEVQYFSFDNKLHKGQILIHKDLQNDVQEIFEVIRKNKFPVGKAVPISEYNWNDEESMLDNNTSAFNYRVVKGTKILSSHSTGRAIDINPFLNPQIKRGTIIPAGANYNVNITGTITADSFIVKEFRKRGWLWGGKWKSTKDYQHFEKK